jgi:drug/metabolite transporter (DMT)-like permease
MQKGLWPVGIAFTIVRTEPTNCGSNRTEMLRYRGSERLEREAVSEKNVSGVVTNHSEKIRLEKVRSSTGSLAGGADWLLLAVPGVIWGASFLFIAEGMRSVGPSGVTFVRILIGFATLSLFPSARKPVVSSDWVGIVGLGVLWLALPLSMFPFAEQHVSSALTGMLNGANPMFTAIVAAAIARRAPTRWVLAGIAMGMAGAVLMALPTIGEGHSSAASAGMIMTALVSCGFALNIARPLQQRHGALPVIWRAQMAALVLVTPLGLPDMIDARWRLGPVIALLALGGLGTGMAYAVMSVAAGRLGATRASGTNFLIPAVALVLGVVVRGERVALLSVIGSVVCVGGAWLMRRAQNSREEQGNGDLRGEQEVFQSAQVGAPDFQEG